MRQWWAYLTTQSTASISVSSKRKKYRALAKSHGQGEKPKYSELGGELSQCNFSTHKPHNSRLGKETRLPRCTVLVSTQSCAHLHVGCEVSICLNLWPGVDAGWSLHFAVERQLRPQQSGRASEYLFGGVCCKQVRIEYLVLRIHKSCYDFQRSGIHYARNHSNFCGHTHPIFAQIRKQMYKTNNSP